ncbi:hypothetical protein [Sorangium sp. So ce1151]|uniref:hypothetical protein n=1 Tax=Sorangium sp. So ce1151 TaxID=3133332 RepID=UPI003F64709F
MKDENATSATDESTKGDEEAPDDQCWGFTMVLAVLNKEGTETLYYEVSSDALTKKRHLRSENAVQSWCKELVATGAQIGHVADEPGVHRLVDMDTQTAHKKVPATTEFCGTYLVNLTGFRRR